MKQKGKVSEGRKETRKEHRGRQNKAKYNDMWENAIKSSFCILP